MVNRNRRPHGPCGGQFTSGSRSEQVEPGAVLKLEVKQEIEIPIESLLDDDYGECSCRKGMVVPGAYDTSKGGEGLLTYTTRCSSSEATVGKGYITFSPTTGEPIGGFLDFDESCTDSDMTWDDYFEAKEAEEIAKWEAATKEKIEQQKTGIHVEALEPREVLDKFAGDPSIGIPWAEVAEEYGYSYDPDPAIISAVDLLDRLAEGGYSTPIAPEDIRRIRDDLYALTI